jgi:manganese oxidase
MRLHSRILLVALMVSVLAAPAFAQCEKAKRVVTADVVALDQFIMLNRIGASIPTGMVFALKRDVVPKTAGTQLGSGNVRLRDGKRPRPIVLRVNQYDCLDITLTNLLSKQPVDPARSLGPFIPPLPATQTATRSVSIHVNGMQLYQMKDDGSWVGNNASSLAPLPPDNTRRYQLYATEQGTFLLYSTGALFGGVNGGNDGAQQTEGLFGAVHVEPPDAEWYRSQVTQADLAAAWTTNSTGQRVLNYGATKNGAPILRMYTTNAGDTKREIVHTDLTAVITGKNHGRFDPHLYPCNDPNGPGCPEGATPAKEVPNPSKCPAGVINPNFACNYAEPDREEPYREFTIIYHELFEVVQAFSDFYVGVAATPDNLDAVGTLGALQDQFAINYGTGGIGAEILANRIGVGPMGGCPDCKYEEFFLDSWTVGDPAMVVDVPANAPVSPADSQKQLDCLYTAWAVTKVGTSSSNLDPSQPPYNLKCAPPAEGTKVTSAPGEGYLMLPKRKATKAFFPDDPSNVYHSYLNDHVKFRILHGGTGFSHVHHQHAHQWLRTPNNNESTYLDSQLINPGSAYTLEMTFGGSGNRNKTPGDSIFHCHFYPHFAGGMWSMWRVHDTFEPGTLMNGDVPAPGYSRALPDAEILAGTPTPALVPMPTIPMAPWPAAVQLVQVTDPGNPSNIIGTRPEAKPADLANKMNPGYPFFIPGIAGVRAPHPPLDFACMNADGTPSTAIPCDAQTLNGGLPRHLFLTGLVTNEAHDRYNFTKDLGKVNAFHLSEEGTPVERVAMNYHEQCAHKTLTPEGKPAEFQTNGLKRTRGAPFADPGLIPYNPNNPPPNFGPPGTTRCEPTNPKDQKYYRAAVFQTDLVFNKQGWHYPQSRMLSLWSDVMPTLNSVRPPEPLFFRTETDDVTDYWHTNLVPDYYLLDDFQVRTPTDIIGQHIHLVKFDVTSSDGASNGWNYEDGTFSPEEVRERIKSINDCGGLLTNLDSAAACGSGNRLPKLTAQPPPKMICGTANNPCPADEDWTGAQTTVQRWMADPLKSPAEDPKIDRTLRTVFTHDHFGPSTHQQTGLYAAFVVEPPDTEWFQNETGVQLGTKPDGSPSLDGSPTSWQAVIQPKKGTVSTVRNTYREFAIALQDFQLAYQNTSITQAAAPLDCNPGINGTSPSPIKCEWTDPVNAVSQTAALGKAALSTITCQNPGTFPTGTPSNCQSSANPVYNTLAQQGVSAGPTQGTYTFNYRNEPLPFRLQSGTNSGNAVDPAYVFSSNVLNRNNTAVNSQPPLGGPINPANPSKFIFPKNPLTFDMQPGDPYTPLLRTYEGDNVQVRVIVGAHMLPHSFTMHGLRWFFEPGDGFVGSAIRAEERRSDSGYRNTQQMGISEHFEFLFRVPKSLPQANGFADFLYMPDASNPQGGRGLMEGTWGIMRAYQYKQSNLKTLPGKTEPEKAPAASTSSKPKWWTAENCKASNTKNFNVYAVNASLTVNTGGTGSAITQSTALIYSKTATAPSSPEPLVLRANAGDCIQVTLTNNFDPTNAVFKNTAAYPFNNSYPSTAAFSPSSAAGLTPALLSYDVPTSSGINIGFNATPATVASTTGSPKLSRVYYWYAGLVGRDGVTLTPAEFGGVNLFPGAAVQQDTYGLMGALIVEPPGAKFTGTTRSDGTKSDAAGIVTLKDGKTFNEFVLVTQDNFTASAGTQPVFNYKAEPMTNRFPSGSTLNNIDLSAGFSNTRTSGKDPQTPVFTAMAGTPVRIHLLHPGGSSDQQVFTLHGHIWQDEPYRNGSTTLGWNPESQWIGSRDLYGTNSSYSILLSRAGGANAVPGDYLYRTHPSNYLLQGLWGILRVTPKLTTGSSAAGGGGK